MELFNYEDIVQRYYNKTLKDKMQSALQTDFINNQGAVAYLSGDTQLAIKKFQEALEIMPVNDDALINLCRCYTKIGNYKKSLEQLEKLYYLEKTNKSKLIAYCLVMLLLEDFDIYGASVYFSNIKTILKENIDVISDYEIKEVIDKLNEPYNSNILYYQNGDIGFGGSSGLGLICMSTQSTTKSLFLEEIKDVLEWE